MSAEAVTTDENFDNTTSTEISTAAIWLNTSGVSTSNTSETDMDYNTTDSAQRFKNVYPVTSTMFEAFIITEMVMTALELIISITTVIKMPRWRKNYRNQMLMQLSLVRFVKRIVLLLKFYDDQSTNPTMSTLTIFICSAQIYVDLVIALLVIFFINHMYNSLIIVLVKISKNTFYKTCICMWFLPVPISAAWTAVLVFKVLDEWTVYLLICCVFKWPIIFLGTCFYIIILYQVLSDKIRKFARSLTILTFLLCLVTNFYLFSKDVIELWCLKSFFTLLISYLSGFLLNFLILCLYAVLIVLNYNHNNKSSRSFPDYSLANVK